MDETNIVAIQVKTGHIYVVMGQLSIHLQHECEVIMTDSIHIQNNQTSGGEYGYDDPSFLG